MDRSAGQVGGIVADFDALVPAILTVHKNSRKLLSSRLISVAVRPLSRLPHHRPLVMMMSTMSAAKASGVAATIAAIVAATDGDAASNADAEARRRLAVSVTVRGPAVIAVAVTRLVVGAVAKALVRRLLVRVRVRRLVGVASTVGRATVHVAMICLGDVAGNQKHRDCNDCSRNETLHNFSPQKTGNGVCLAEPLQNDRMTG